MRSRQGRAAATTWLLCLALGTGAGLLIVQGDVRAAIVLGIASTSTALGTLLPILQESGTHRSRLGAAMHAGTNTTAQTMLRLTMLILITLMVVSGQLDLDMSLGAFMAGMLIGRLLPVGEHELLAKIQVLGFSFLIPVFFVTSGMSIDLATVSSELGGLAAFVVTILLARALPVLLREQLTDTGSGITSVRERVGLGLYASAGLPIIVAVTEIAGNNGLLTEAQASVMVAGGAVTVLLFPLQAGVLAAGAAEPDAPPASDPSGRPHVA